MEPTLLTANQIAAKTGVPVAVIAELLSDGPLSAFQAGGISKYNELDVLRAEIGCLMLGAGVRWPLVTECLKEMAYYSYEELVSARRSWTHIHPKTLWRTAATTTTFVVLILLIGIALGKYL